MRRKYFQDLDLKALLEIALEEGNWEVFFGNYRKES